MSAFSWFCSQGSSGGVRPSALALATDSFQVLIRRSRRVHGWERGGFAAYFEEADVRMVGRGNLGFSVQRVAQRPLHIGLAGVHPHVTHHYVSQSDRVASLHRKFKRPAGLRGRQVDGPEAQIVGCRCACFPQERDRYGFTARGPAPDVNRLPLQVLMPRG